MVHYLLPAFLGYFIGSINPAFLIGKLRGVDIRTKGSKNAGASNAMMVLGKSIGSLVMAADIFKAVFAVLICRALFPALPQASAVAGSACIIGHMFPCFMGFRGGKGFACLGGFALAYDWRMAAILFPIVLGIALITNYVFLGAVFGSLAVPITMGLRGNWYGALCLLVSGLLMIYRHKINFIRVQEGTEMGFSWLWSKNRREMEQAVSRAADDLD
ncbi:MAG: glycerol-3-phosphate acyltransferase [Oscillospiraceae bacterium]|nr:glycerol-3-phosphate acyltransferase [Oscillospiraceae bacterium]